MNALRQLDRLTQNKLDRALLRQANKTRLARVRAALARIEEELAAAIAQHRRRSASMADLVEESWLRRIKHARAEIEATEL
jgi:hypothetical protein